MSIVILLWIGAFVSLVLLIALMDEPISIVIGMITTVFFIFAIVMNGQWLASKSKTKIINNTYGTNYTREDVFWNGALIEKQLMAKNEIVSDSKNQNINLNIKSDKDGAVVIAPNR
jgi:hypothetical protein